MCASYADTHIQVASWDGSRTVFGHRGRRVSARERSRLSCVGHRLGHLIRPFQHPNSAAASRHLFDALPVKQAPLPPPGHAILLLLFLLQKLQRGKTGWPLFCARRAGFHASFLFKGGRLHVLRMGRCSSEHISLILLSPYILYHIIFSLDQPAVAWQ